MPSKRYDDAFYGVITRKWFGLPIKFGDTGTALTIGSAATCVSKVARWYPRGPITMVKAGFLVLATLEKRVASGLNVITRFFADGASASVGITHTLAVAASKTAAYTISSSVTITRGRVKAGGYVKIKMATPQTDEGTRLTASVLGSLAYFIDYKPLFDPARWGA